MEGEKIKIMQINLKKSPLNELILGIQFDDPVLTTNHIVEIIENLKPQYSELSEHPPLPLIIESPDKPKTQRLLNRFASRIHIIHNDKTKLVQVQPDRILFNWRKTAEDSVYPKFIMIYEEFKKIMKSIDKKLSIDLYNRINQFEFTYIDHIYLEDFNIDSYQLNEILNIFEYKSIIKELNFEFSIPKVDIGGVLNTSIKSAKNKIDSRKLFVVENTCRGFISDDSIDSWFNKSHDILIENFINIITDKAKEIWQYKD